MTTSSEDSGVIVSLMKRFNEHRLPEALVLKARVEHESDDILSAGAYWSGMMRTVT